ncbi:hypothetical protein V1264_002961 [Littorina saxatilis]|uniref:Uncharacterized protein n=1 Tax=Littorina saxatilis TaxID=31220 RepID=A0AAN9B4E3_9CAEN
MGASNPTTGVCRAIEKSARVTSCLAMARLSTMPTPLTSYPPLILDLREHQEQVTLAEGQGTGRRRDFVRSVKTDDITSKRFCFHPPVSTLKISSDLEDSEPKAAIPLPSASSESLGPGPDHAFAKRDTTTCEGIVIGTQTTSSWQSCK